jgi:lipopolysaccharide export system permease protein
MIIILFNGENYVDMPENDNRRYSNKSYPFRRDKFAKQVINIPLEGFNFQRSDEGLFRSNYQMMNLKQLKYTTDSLVTDLHRDKLALKNNLIYSNYYTITVTKQPFNFRGDTTKANIKFSKFTLNKVYNQLSDYEKVSALSYALNEARNAKSTISSESQVHKSKEQRLRKHEIEWHKKFTLSFACIIFFFIGAPLGAIIRKGGLGMPLVISVIFFVFYYVISLMGEKFVRESLLPAYEGSWIASMVLMPLGIFLTYKATHDAAFMRVENYIMFFNKYFNVKKLKRLFIKNTESEL